MEEGGVNRLLVLQGAELGSVYVRSQTSRAPGLKGKKELVAGPLRRPEVDARECREHFPQKRGGGQKLCCRIMTI